MKRSMTTYLIKAIICVLCIGSYTQTKANNSDCFKADMSQLQQFLAIYAEKMVKSDREIANEISKIRAFGSWAISESLYNYILALLSEGSSLLELGSGWGTGELAKKYTMHSIENDPAWVGKYNSHYIHAPIVNSWYDVAVLEKELPQIKYDLILVDGPWGTIGRIGFFHNIGLFNTNVPLIFDDVHRKDELELLKKVATYLNRPYEIFTSKQKSFGVILPS